MRMGLVRVQIRTLQERYKVLLRAQALQRIQPVGNKPAGNRRYQGRYVLGHSTPFAIIDSRSEKDAGHPALNA
ncbi:MAG: hypothetical protein AAFY39_18715, partial [Pseudomonadota bacterium]